MKLLISIVCILISAFCAFGFLATFEPGPHSFIVFRVGYAVVGLVCVAIVLLQFRGRSDSDESR